MEISQNSLKFLSSLDKEPSAAPSPAITRTLNRLEVQFNALREDVGRSRERLLARESK